MVTLKMRKEDTDAVLSKVSQDPYTQVWRAPHVYSYFDTRMVRKSNAQLADMEGAPYGNKFCFQEFVMLPPEMIMQASAIQEAGGDKGPAGPSVDAEKEALMDLPGVGHSGSRRRQGSSRSISGCREGSIDGAGQVLQ